MIPRLIHFIFGMAPQIGQGEFALHHYLAVRSAADMHPSHKIVLWHGSAPTGNPYWDAAGRYCEFVHVDPPTHIYGNVLNHHAHRTDVVRLQVLEAHGGIYLDLDTLILRPFDDLFVPDTGMAFEVNPTSQRPEGLCNAVILSRPRATFVRRWLDSFEFFHSGGMDNAYAFYACRMPLILSRQYGADITVMPHHLFFKYSWDEKGLSDIFGRSSSTEGLYSIHLWDHMAKRFLHNLTVDRIREKDTTFNIFARKYLQGDANNTGDLPKPG